METTNCFNPPDEVMFVQGTVRAIVESLYGADMGSFFRAYDDTTGLRVCAHAYANVAVKHRGAQASGWASIIGVRTVDIVYPDKVADDVRTRQNSAVDCPSPAQSATGPTLPSFHESPDAMGELMRVDR